jgi:hypothetical protein
MLLIFVAGGSLGHAWSRRLPLQSTKGKLLCMNMPVKNRKLTSNKELK